jgi:inner membrane protein YhjD
MINAAPQSRADRVRARIRAARARWAWFDHAVRAYERNTEVLGGQLSAAVTYFGFLSFFPLLALAFSLVGYISGAFPDAQESVTRAIEDNFPSLIGSGSGQLDIQDVIDAKAGAGIIGLVGLAYAGLGWLDAMRAALRRVFNTSDLPLGFVKKKAIDTAVLGGLGLAMLASLAVSSLATSLTSQALGVLGLDDSVLALALLKVLSVALALLADTVLFAILIGRLSGARLSWRRVRSAALLGAVGFELLKLIGTFLIARTTQNPVYATFGVIVGLLIWINLVSQLLMFVAAWAATQPYSELPEAVPTPPAAAAVAVRRRRLRPALLGAALGAGVVALLTRRRKIKGAWDKSDRRDAQDH